MGDNGDWKWVGRRRRRRLPGRIVCSWGNGDGRYIIDEVGMTTSGDVVPQALLLLVGEWGYANSVPRRGENVIMERNGGGKLRILTL